MYALSRTGVTLITKLKKLTVKRPAVGAMHFAEKLHDVAKLALNCFFSAR